MSSAYMQWAKKRSGSRYNLATSGLRSATFAGLGLTAGDMDPITRSGDYGYPPLTEIVASHCGVAPENVVTAAGTSMANMLAMAALVAPGDEVLVEHPTYELLLAAVGYLQADVRRFSRRAETGFTLEPAEIERVITPRTRLIVITNLHNPSSAFSSEDTLRAVGELARRAGARVLVDEVYLDAAFPLAPRSAALLGPEFVVTSSLTKVYGLSGLRCGWILAEPELARRIWLLDDLFDVNMAHPAERLSVVVFRNFERVREQARTLLETNRVVLNQFLSERRDLDVRPMEFGTTIFPKLLTGAVDRFCELFRNKYDGTVVPGSFFEMPDHFRIGIGGETEPLKESLERLKTALDAFGR
jgi:aspartate/methionine/tyrosine aminotransferase